MGANQLSVILHNALMKLRQSIEGTDEKLCCPIGYYIYFQILLKCCVNWNLQVELGLEMMSLRINLGSESKMQWIQIYSSCWAIQC